MRKCSGYHLVFKISVTTKSGHSTSVLSTINNVPYANFTPIGGTVAELFVHGQKDSHLKLNIGKKNAIHPFIHPCLFQTEVHS